MTRQQLPEQLPAQLASGAWLVQRESASRRLLAQLGLPLDDTVVEWHRWAVGAEPEPEPEPEPDTGVPFGSAGWRYWIGPEADTTDKSAPALDDSAWAVGAAPFGNHAATHTNLGWITPPATAAPTSSTIWLRRRLTLPAGGVRVTVNARYDGNLAIYWNGELVRTGTDNVGTARFTVAADKVAAANVLAVRVRDDTADPISDWTYLDVELVIEPASDPGGYASAVLADSPAGYWRLAGNLVDDSGNGHDGNAASLPPPPAWAQTVPGLLTGDTNAALQYPGNATAQPRVDFGPWMTTNTLTLEAVVKPSNNSSRGLLDRDAFSGRVFQWRLDGSGRLDLILFLNGQVRQLLSPNPVPVGQTSHLAATWDGATARLYVNGVQVAASVGWTGTLTYATNLSPNLAIGHLVAGTNGNGGVWPFVGVLDEVAYYTTALAADRIAKHAAAVTDPSAGAAPTPAVPASTPTPSATPPAVAGWALDPDRTVALSSYAVTWGRTDTTQQPGPLQVSVALARELLGETLPAAGERFRLTISDTVADELGLAPEDRPRFTGEVTDVDESLGAYVTVTGVGRRSRLERLPAGAVAIAQQDAGTRVRRLLDDARQLDPVLQVGVVDAGGYQLLRREAGLTTTGALIGEVAEDTGGQLVEQRDGSLDWHGTDHRRGATPVAALDGQTELLRPFNRAQGIGAVQNVADVAWGADQQVARVTGVTADPAELGPLGVQLSTRLVAEADAYSRATDVVGRRGRPTWTLPALAVDVLRSLAGDDRARVLALRHGDLVDVTALPLTAEGELPRVFVEGGTETHTRTSWRVQLAVSDPATSGAGLRWIDVPAGITWNDVKAGLSWLDVAPITDPQQLRS